MLRSFLLKLPAYLQLFVIVLVTIVVAFASSSLLSWIFGSFDVSPKADVITAIYTVLGTVYAVLLAFTVSGVWQNFTETELAVTAEAATLIDLIHIVRVSNPETANKINDIAIEYVNHVITAEWALLKKGDSGLVLSTKSRTFFLSMELVNAVQRIQPETPRDLVVFSQMLTLLTKWLDARRRRVNLSKGNIARSLWPVLIAGAFIIFSFHGIFVFQNSLLWVTLLFCFSGVIGIAFYLIFSLDSPFSGSPVVSASPFEWALTWFNHNKLAAHRE